MSSSASHASRLASVQPLDDSHRVAWTPPESTAYLPPSPNAKDRSERTTAIVVIALTLACTALSIFDLFLLASGFS